MKKLLIIASFVVMSSLAHATSVVATPSFTTDFESASLGSVNGQDGWSVSGPYDQSVVDTSLYTTVKPSWGTKAFRISNNYASGGFGDQTFTKSLDNAVGETTSTAGSFSNATGTLQNHFEMEFEMASATTTEQSGLAVTVSPDRGDGSRMSYLKFADTAAGIDVIFYDVEGATNPANFVPTTVATLDRSTAHTIKLTMDTREGPSNDLVKIYVDGSLVHVGTSWENYYRYDSEASAEQSQRLVKDVLFRVSASAPTLGAGYLFDNLTLSSSIEAAPARALIVAPSTNTFGQAVTVNGTTYYSGIDTYSTIQSAIDAALPGETVYVTAGAYDETAANRTVNGASYQFGLFFGTSTVSVQGDGNVVVTTNATNNFGPSGVFVAADNITLSGIEFSTNASGLNKTIEVIGDNFTLTNSKLSDPDGGDIYISDFTPDQKVNKYTITGNTFENGANITLASGAGQATSSPVTDRQITGNTFKGTTNDYARISFSGAGGQPWYVYPVGGAVITGNTFEGDDKWYIRARGTYTESQFDWQSFWNNNTFRGASVALSNENDFALRDYAYASYSNVRSIGSDLAWVLANASSSDTVLVNGALSLNANIGLYKALTLKGDGNTTLTAAVDYGTDNASKQMLNIFSTTSASISNLTFDCNFKCYGVQAYGNAQASFDGVTFKNSKGAGLLVNGSTVSVNNVTTSGNTWGGINVDLGSGVTSTSTLIVNGTSLHSESNAIWIDDKTKPAFVGDVNGQYSTSTFGNTVSYTLIHLNKKVSAASLSNATVTAAIPEGVIVSGNQTWNGVISAPTATTTVVSEPGYFPTTGTGIQIGSSDSDLVFDKGVRLVFAGEAGKHVGWFNHAGTFSAINAICSADSQSSGDALPAAGSCKIDAGSDLVVWTKHFSTFVTYAPVSSVTTVGGGSGFSGGGSSGGSSSGTTSNASTGARATTTGQVLGVQTSATSTGKGQVLGVSTYNFTANAGVGSRGDAVSELQKVLIAQGFLKISAPTGYFGSLTKTALAKWQTKYKVPATGYFGALSRAAILGQ